MAVPDSLIQMDAVLAARAQRQPFPFLVADRILAPDDAARLHQDFPDYREAGFFPHRTEHCGPTVNRLIDELDGAAFADAVGRVLGIEDLAQRPSLVTICKHLNRRHGTIHTDSRSKIATALIYLNADWPDISGGCLRFLNRIDDIDDLAAPEIRPLYGTLAAFRRTDNSFHGHLSHEGERRVIQIAWLVDEDAKARKDRRGRYTRWLKKLLGRVDRRLGAGRRERGR